METNIKEMTIDQLKAIAYDQIELAEKCRANILTIQMEIKAREANRAIPEAPVKQPSELAGEK
jgi:hypothetical protein